MCWSESTEGPRRRSYFTCTRESIPVGTCWDFRPSKSRHLENCYRSMLSSPHPAVFTIRSPAVKSPFVSNEAPPLLSAIPLCSRVCLVRQCFMKLQPCISREKKLFTSKHRSKKQSHTSSPVHLPCTLNVGTVQKATISDAKIRVMGGSLVKTQSNSNEIISPVRHTKLDRSCNSAQTENEWWAIIAHRSSAHGTGNDNILIKYIFGQNLVLIVSDNGTTQTTLLRKIKTIIR